MKPHPAKTALRSLLLSALPVRVHVKFWPDRRRWIAGCILPPDSAGVERVCLGEGKTAGAAVLGMLAEVEAARIAPAAAAGVGAVERKGAKTSHALPCPPGNAI